MQKVKLGLREGRLPLLKIFCAGFLAGMILLIIGKSIWLEYTGLLDENTLYQMKYMTVDRNALFYYVLKERMGSVLILTILSTTYLGLAVCGLAVLWYGMGAGVLLAIATTRYGLKGILLVCSGLFPHYLIYIPGFVFLLLWCEKIYRLIYLERRDVIRGMALRQMTSHILGLLTVLLLLLTGCMLEGYVNPPILQRLLQTF